MLKLRILSARYVSVVNLQRRRCCERCRRRATDQAGPGVRRSSVDDSPWSTAGAPRLIDPLCALCVSPPRAIICDVIDDVTVRRCLIRRAIRRHDDQSGVRVSSSLDE